MWSLAGGLTQPILTGGALRSEFARLKSDDRSNLAQLQSTVLRAFGEVEQSLVAEHFLAEREAAMSKAVETAIDAADAAASEYSGGTGDALTRSRTGLLYFHKNSLFAACVWITGSPFTWPSVGTTAPQNKLL